MNRAKVLRAAWYLLKEAGERPSRRKLQALVGHVSGKTFSTDEVHAWLKSNQYKGEDGFFYLHKTPGPVEVQARSKPGPVSGPVRVLKNDDIGPDVHSNQVQVRSPHTDQKKKRENKDIPPSSSNELLSPPKGKVRLVAQTVNFESEDERRVGQCLVLVAAQNKTGMISSARILTLRAQMHSQLESIGPERWRYGLDEAIARGMPWDYARAVMRKTLDVPAVPKLTLVQHSGASRAGADRKRGWANDAPNPDKLAAIDALIKRNAQTWGAARSPDQEAVS